MSIIGYGSADAVNSRGPSPSIWADCPLVAFQKDPSKGIHRFDDFTNSVVPTEEAARGALTGGIGTVNGDINWYAFAESALVADVALQADDEGVLMLDQDGTDDDDVSITTGDNVIGTIRSPRVGETQKFWFEARVKLSTITNGDLVTFIGLTQPGQAKANGVIGAGGVLNDVDYFGFHVDEADGDAVDLVYNEASAGTKQAKTGKIAIAVDTYVRLGMKLQTDGVNLKIRWFKDGVDLGDDVAVDIATANANWPGDTNMDVVIAIHSGATGEDADNLKIDWVRYAQEF